MDYPDAWIAPQQINTHGKYVPWVPTLAVLATTLPASRTPTANVQQLVPFTIPGPYQIRSFFMGCGIASGNVDMGIFAAPGGTGSALQKLVSTGSTAASGLSTIQIIALGTPYVLSAGTYYMAFVVSAGSYTQSVVSSTVAQAIGLLEGSTAFPLGATTTPVVSTQLAIPLMGISRLASGY